jgi:hypothetical protein
MGSDLFNGTATPGSRAHAKLLRARQRASDGRGAPGEQNCDTELLEKSLPKVQAMTIAIDDDRY